VHLPRDRQGCTRGLKILSGVSPWEARVIVLLVYTRIMFTLDEAKQFDYFLKANVPTLICLLQSINGVQKYENFVRTS
jgi:hypothetical protein